MKTIRSLSLIVLFVSVSVGSLRAQFLPVAGSDILLDKLRLNKGIEGMPETFL